MLIKHILHMQSIHITKWTIINIRIELSLFYHSLELFYLCRNERKQSCWIILSLFLLLLIMVYFSMYIVILSVNIIILILNHYLNMLINFAPSHLLYLLFYYHFRIDTIRIGNKLWYSSFSLSYLWYYHTNPSTRHHECNIFTILHTLSL